jgi:hypothetical protein
MEKHKCILVLLCVCVLNNLLTIQIHLIQLNNILCCNRLMVSAQLCTDVKVYS